MIDNLLTTPFPFIAQLPKKRKKKKEVRKIRLKKTEGFINL